MEDISRSFFISHKNTFMRYAYIQNIIVIVQCNGNPKCN